MSTIIDNIQSDLNRCKKERIKEEQIKKLEEERLQEILSFCQKYNQQNFNQFSNNNNNNNDNNDNEFMQQLNKNQDKNDLSNKCNDDSDTDTDDSHNNNGVIYEKIRKNCLDKNNDDDDSFMTSDSSSDCLSQNKKQNSSFESLKELMIEESLICGEINELENQKSNNNNNNNDNSNSNNNSNDDDEDDDLIEFQRIENEIKISELKKGLELIRKQIEKHKNKANGNAPLAESESFTTTVTDTTIDEDDDEEEEEDKDKYNDEEQDKFDTTEQIVQKRNKVHRPLTLYLPSADEQLNLIEHITTLGHDLTTQHSLTITKFTCSGYLYKLCSNSKWKKRFFHFDRQNKVFVYFKTKRQFKKSNNKPSGGVYFDEIHDVYVDHNRIKLRYNNSNTRYVFVIATSSRQFVLSTFKPELMRIWIDVVFTGAQAYQYFHN